MDNLWDQFIYGGPRMLQTSQGTKNKSVSGYKANVFNLQWQTLYPHQFPSQQLAHHKYMEGLKASTSVGPDQFDWLTCMWLSSIWSTEWLTKCANLSTPAWLENSDELGFQYLKRKISSLTDEQCWKVKFACELSPSSKEGWCIHESWNLKLQTLLWAELVDRILFTLYTSSDCCTGPVS